MSMWQVTRPGTDTPDTDPAPPPPAPAPQPSPGASWKPVGNIRGPQGPQGPQGPAGDVNAPDLLDLTVIFENGLT